MIQMLIVEDESAIRNGLLRHIDWKSLGIDIIQAAENAQEALQICQSYRPDLLISDIRMRGMNGVEMCQILHEQYPQCRIIFISGYSDKEYLKAAIQLGAVDYIEKPINPTTLRGTVQKAMESILELRSLERDSQKEQARSFTKREAFFPLLKSGLPPEELRAVTEGNPLFQKPYSAIRVCILHMSVGVVNLSRFCEAVWSITQMDSLVGEDCRVACEFWDNRRLILLLCGQEESIGNSSIVIERLSNLCRQTIENIRLFLAVGPIVRTPAEISSSYEQAYEAEKTIFLKGYGQTSFHGFPQQSIQLDAEYTKVFQRALQNSDEAAARQVLEQIADSLRCQKVAASAWIQGLYLGLKRDLDMEYIRRFPDDKNCFVQKWETDAQIMQGMDTLCELTDFLLQKVHDMMQQIIKDDTNHSVVMRVMEIIQQEYGNSGLSIKELAQRVYLTPTYLSGLFKRNTGSTIGEYITRVRMEHAEKLMQLPQYKLYQVASLVGYDDPNYFAKLFKKQMGVTPSEYKEKYR